MAEWPKCGKSEQKAANQISTRGEKNVEKAKHRGKADMVFVVFLFNVKILNLLKESEPYFSAKYVYFFS